MKFNVFQLNKIIVALFSNGFNRKFASNVRRLCNLFNPDAYKTDYEKEFRVYLIKELCDIILENKLEDKESILSFLDVDGKYYSASVTLLNELYKENADENEMIKLDEMVSNQLRYSAIMEKGQGIADKIMNIQAENYDNLEDAVLDLESNIDVLSKDIKGAKESIENSKNDMSLSSSGFVSILGTLIQKERNPNIKIKTGIQYLNKMFNGGFERG